MKIGYTQQDNRFLPEFSNKLPLLRSLWNECDAAFSNSNNACTLVKLPLSFFFFADSSFIGSFEVALLHSCEPAAKTVGASPECGHYCLFIGSPVLSSASPQNWMRMHCLSQNKTLSYIYIQDQIS